MKRKNKTRRSFCNKKIKCVMYMRLSREEEPSDVETEFSVSTRHLPIKREKFLKN